MNIQAQVAMDKEKHPERYCPYPRCLWKVVQLDPSPAQTYSPRPDCPNGRCPRHQLSEATEAKISDELITMREQSLGYPFPLHPKGTKKNPMYDQKCHDLAMHFLPESKEDLIEVRELAQCIQDAIEDWLAAKYK